MEDKKPKKIKDMVGSLLGPTEATDILETALTNAVNGSGVPAVDRNTVIAAWAYLFNNGYRTIPTKPPPQ